MLKKHLRWAIPLALVEAVIGYGLKAGGAAAPEVAPEAPAKTVKPLTEIKAPEGREMATFAGGCFWSMEAMFAQLKGVDKVEPGYAGGAVANPTYEQVCADTTGHAETVHIVFDPKVVTYAQLLHIFFRVHNPTTLNQQGPDSGSQYRSAVFTHDEAQRQAALAAISEVEKEKIWDGRAVTQLEAFSNFYRAEEHHLNYYNQHLDEPYCKYVIAPKIEKFHAHFKDQLKP